ncbi:hypothetical protein FOMPIDRAFT_1025007 [Fomitopsis schrenkii]|uniref:Uncharacterized protein n=1 Tax=Fomitopsis schrenkii TaxID=2126942 RepID=S8DY64_FOMSC|nr:hypothetical protein FOMPIDRAFT_1025007 [Fomitopsis schrenkii]
MRAEYVAPLGSTSLIFNFLFAKFLVDTPVTNYDIYGTIIVILGVIGIVAFGSINSGIGDETSAEHLAYLWSRSNWLVYFFFMAFSLIIVYVFVAQLEQVLTARGDINAEPFAGMGSRRSGAAAPVGFHQKVMAAIGFAMMWVREKLESWIAPQDDKRVAWTLGIGWACCGGGLSGGCLVFAKASVKVISGSLSHQNSGNQIGRASTIFTFIFLAITAVSQIICLNRGLKVYDSTLVVPVFYGVYTAAGFLDSLIFNDEVDAYEPWALFLIFVSMIILISGVVLLTYKKPEKKVPPAAAAPGNVAMASRPAIGVGRPRRKSDGDGEDEQDALHTGDEPEPEEVWQIGSTNVSDDEDGALPHTPRPTRHRSTSARSRGEGEEERMIGGDEEEGRASTSSDATLARPDNPPPYADDEFGSWEQGKLRR